MGTFQTVGGKWEYRSRTVQLMGNGPARQEFLFCHQCATILQHLSSKKVCAGVMASARPECGRSRRVQGNLASAKTFPTPGMPVPPICTLILTSPNTGDG